MSAWPRGCQTSVLTPVWPGRLTPTASPASLAALAGGRSLPVAAAAWLGDDATRPANDDGNGENLPTVNAGCAPLRLQRAAELPPQPINPKTKLFDVT